MESAPEELKLVERAAIVALATSGGRLHETTDLRQRLGLAFTRAHRLHLIETGLVRSQKKSAKSLELTDDGWARAEVELRALKPAGTMGLGTLYAVLGELGRVLASRGENLRSFFANEASSAVDPDTADKAPRDITSLTEVVGREDYGNRIGEAAWAEADGALAIALQDIPSFARALERARLLPEQERSKQYDSLMRQIELSAGQVFQNIKRAASRRDLVVQHSRGAAVAFDAAAYDANDTINQGEQVKVVKPAVVRQGGNVLHVIARGIADHC